MISKLEPSSEDAIFAFMEKALENSHVKVKQTAMHLLTLSFRVASAQPSIRLKLGSFVSQLKPRIRKEVEKKLGDFLLFLFWLLLGFFSNQLPIL